MAKKTTKRAVCVGVNDYPGTRNDLKGCINDANDWAELLRDEFGFGDNVELLTDADATRSNIATALGDLVTGAGGGDVVAFTYSGHGTWVPDRGEQDEFDNRDEALAVYDGIILDDELRSIIGQIDRDATLTVISDSCHSGTTTRLMLDRALEGDAEAVKYAPKPRFMPPEDVAYYGGKDPIPVRRRFLYPESNMPEILLTGCNAAQSSYDAYIGGRYNGALTATAIRLMKDNPGQTYREFYRGLRKRLPSPHFDQCPQLEGADANKDRRLFS